MRLPGGQSLITLIEPMDFQMLQRDEGDSGPLLIRGTAHERVTAEVSFDGGSWQTIITNLKGLFTASFSIQGQGDLVIRPIGDSINAQIVHFIGVGDVYTLAGQSNASGRGMKLQSFNHPTLRATELANSYAWTTLVDPVDVAGKVDLVADDLDAFGSVWPLVATSYVASANVPIAFVPCAKGATSILSWLPGPNHSDRSTLYGSMAVRSNIANSRAILWWQGETDALNGMTATTYRDNLLALADAIYADLGVSLMPCKLQNCSAVSVSAINQGIEEAWAHPHVLVGPDLSDISTDDGFHLIVDSKLALAAGRWAAAMMVTL